MSPDFLRGHQPLFGHIIRLGRLEHKISKKYNTKDISKFTRLANTLEKLFARVNCSNHKEQRN